MQPALGHRPSASHVQRQALSFIIILKHVCLLVPRAISQILTMIVSLVLLPVQIVRDLQQIVHCAYQQEH